VRQKPFYDVRCPEIVGVNCLARLFRKRFRGVSRRRQFCDSSDAELLVARRDHHGGVVAELLSQALRTTHAATPNPLRRSRWPPPRRPAAMRGRRRHCPLVCAALPSSLRTLEEEEEEEEEEEGAFVFYIYIYNDDVYCSTERVLPSSTAMSSSASHLSLQCPSLSHSGHP
jgi:hypothetical protein